MSQETFKDKKRGLGKGLDSLFKETEKISKNRIPQPALSSEGYRNLELIKIKIDLDQPRKTFSEKSLEELSQSILKNGILQPLVVSENKQGFYHIIAGERRFRAAQKAGLKKVPVIIRAVESKKETLEVALIENLQREDLNVLEEAEAYEKLIREYHMTQVQVAEAVNKERSTVANILRILSLPSSVKTYLQKGELSLGQAKVLLSCPIKALQIEFAKKAVKNQLNVRKLQALVSSHTKKSSNLETKRDLSFLKPLTNQLEKKFRTTVRINYRGGKGTIEMEFYSNEQLSELVKTLRT